ncbi:MAG: PmoA family protein [Acidobacteriota bacterium]
MRISTRLSTTLTVILLLVTAGAAQSPRIQVVPNDAGRRVDVIIDGKPFTSYIYPTVLKKPTLFPLRTATGTIITRGYPLEPRPGERVDHPHHVGLWFNHGDVNGLDFWNNSDEIPAAQAPKMGTIQHTRVVSAKGGADRGELSVEAEWVKPDGKALMREQTSYVFRGDATSRTIDRVTTLTALGEKVVFKDIKEGVFGMRVARGLEQPDKTAQIFTDASGKRSSTKVVDNTGVSGEYLTSEGVKGDAVWGTRGHWALLAGTVDSQPVTVAILDHPSNPGFPTYWHARGYGLFAANPLGEHDFTQGKKDFNLTLEPGKSTTFRYRVLILNGTATAETVEQKYAAFAKEGS